MFHFLMILSFALLWYFVQNRIEERISQAPPEFDPEKVRFSMNMFHLSLGMVCVDLWDMSSSYRALVGESYDPTYFFYSDVIGVSVATIMAGVSWMLMCKRIEGR